MVELLRYDHINIRYGQSLVIEDVDFNLASGEILGIVGESGSGKSTLLKAGMGLLGKEGQLCRGKIWGNAVKEKCKRSVEGNWAWSFRWQEAVFARFAP